MEENKIRSLIVCGDIHGKLKQLVFEITEHYKIENASVIVCGDFGAGFESKQQMDIDYKKCLRRLEDHDITLYAIRGNHDDPEYFRHPDKYNYPRLKFLEDHQVYEIEGRTVYTIGGANSVDYIWRLEWNDDPEHKRKGRKVWWEDEDIVKMPTDKFPTYTVDIIVSHEAPLSFAPIISRPEGLDSMQYGRILASRTYLNEVLKVMNVKYWFYGHYHTSYSGSYNEIIWRCLNELELFQVPDKHEQDKEEIKTETEEDGNDNNK